MTIDTDVDSAAIPASIPMERIRKVVAEACQGLPGASAETVIAEATRGFYPGITPAELELA